MIVDSIPTGVEGLDEILAGGYPLRRISLIRGSSGCGKTIYSMLFASKNATKSKPSVFVTFDESPNNLKQYIKSFKLSSHIHILDFRSEPGVTMTGGELELGGMLVRIENAINKTGSNCLVLDAFDVLLSMFEQKSKVITELQRVFAWCLEHGMTLVMTSGEDMDYRQGRELLDYMCDCYVHLKQETEHDLLTRKLQVIKCRGRKHWTSAYPFLINSAGISLMPVTATNLRTKISSKRISTGIKELDSMLGGKGLWLGSASMITGFSGTGKSLLALNILHAACARKEKALYYSFEESADQIVRNSKKTKLDVSAFIKSNLLKIESTSAIEQSIEEHILRIIHDVQSFKPKLVVIDPITSLSDISNARTMKNMVIRLCHFFKHERITLIMTELIADNEQGESKLHASSLIDTWIRLRNLEMNGEHNRMIHIHKSRGSETAKQVKEFIISKNGLSIEKPYIGSGGILFGTAKKQKILTDELNKKAIKKEIMNLKQQLKLRQNVKKNQMDESTLQNQVEICRIEQQIVNLEGSLEKEERLSLQNNDIRELYIK